MWPAARAYVADLERRFGRSALSAIVVMTFVNAVADGNAHFFAQFYCKLDLQLPPSEAQGMLIPLRGAWALKPLWGTLTDAFPLCGYRYKPYVGLMGALGCIAMVLLFSLPPSTALAACCFLMISICTGWVDVLCNAVITSACRAEADGGRKGAADLQAMSIAVFAVGSLVGNALGGLMFTLSGGSARQCFGFSALFPAALLLLARSMDEPKAAPSSGSGGGSRLESVRGAYEALRPAGAGGGAVLQAALFVALSAAIVPVCIICSAEEREKKKLSHWFGAKDFRFYQDELGSAVGESQRFERIRRSTSRLLRSTLTQTVVTGQSRCSPAVSRRLPHSAVAVVVLARAWPASV
jgi:MFS family permease